MKRAAVGKNATTGLTKYLLAKHLLKNGVLQVFENAARTACAKTKKTTRQ